jgi:poly(A)-specific ribonuclease
MEVDKVSFYPLLLDILTDISECHFVAFDLELSGVPSKGAKGGKDVGRPSLQERYLETKQAAERYQILQLGLTCVQQDIENKKYILKPYNFELSPLIADTSLGLERIFSFQSGAVDFLLKTGFDLSVPFHRGVPYLSRLESKEAREKHAARQDRAAIPDVQLKPTETESLAFLERVRREINAWDKSKAFTTPAYLNIGAVGSDDMGPDDVPPALSRFEMRLVHQVVRAEYPELISVGKRGFVQIIKFDHEREERIAADRKRVLHEKIGRQKGFRWIIEALRGSDISNIDLKECAKDPVTGEAIFADLDAYKAQFFRAHNLMRGNPRIMVGHNCFLDLVYIYRTFIGELPDTVEEFQQAIHEIWPMIVDTKYMSTHNCGDINPVSALDQIADQLSIETTPTLEMDSEHMKYSATQHLHEAGYDSFLTAQIAVRLSAKLERAGKYFEPGSAANGAVDGVSNGLSGMKLTESALAHHVYQTEGGSSPSEPEGFVPSVEGAKWKRRGDPTLPPMRADDPFEYNPRDLKHRHKNADAGKKGFEGGMPGFSSDFWRVYGNKLRVFGTEEGMCVLSGNVDDESPGGVAIGEEVSK